MLSRNDPVSGLRVFRSAQHYGLAVQRGVFTRGQPPWRYLRPLKANLFLSAHLSDVRAALDRAVMQLQSAGWVIEEADPQWPAQAREYPLIALQQAGLAYRYGETWRRDPGLFDPDIGAQIELAAGYVRAIAPDGGLPGGEFDFPVVSVGATENALMAAVLCTGLVGCAGDVEELQQWTEAKRREAKPNVPKLQPPKKFDPEPYTSAQAVDPFSNQKLTQALKRESAQSTSNAKLVAPELARRKEPLESFPLDAMAMVGSVSKQGQPFALLRVDNLLYQVKVGDYLGQNYGRITRIAETEIGLREIVQDAAGEWIERPASLQLQERAR